MFSLSVAVLFLLSTWSKDLYNTFNRKIYQKKCSSISAFDKLAKTLGCCWHRCNPWLSIKSTLSFEQFFLQGQMTQLLLGPIGAQHWQLHKELSKHALQHNLYSKWKCKYCSKPQQDFCPSWNHFIFDDEIMHKDWVPYFADSCSPKEFSICVFPLLRGDMPLGFTKPGYYFIKPWKVMLFFFFFNFCKQMIIYIFRTKDLHSILWLCLYYSSTSLI